MVAPAHANTNDAGHSKNSVRRPSPTCGLQILRAAARPNIRKFFPLVKDASTLRLTSGNDAIYYAPFLKAAAREEGRLNGILP